MSGGVLESIAINIVADIILKTVQIGYHVVNSTRLYAKEAQESVKIIQLQIGIWEAASRKLQDENIRNQILPADLLRFQKASEELHRLMRKFVLRHCLDKAESKRIREIHSVDELIEQLDQQRILEKLSEREKKQSWGFWARLKEEVGYLVVEQAREKQLMMQIVFWGTQLDRFSAAAFPSMFPTIPKENVEQLANLLASKLLPELNARAEVLLVRSVDSTAKQVGELSLGEPGPFKEDISQIKLVDRDGVLGGYIRPPSPRLDTPQEDVAREQANRTDLGGKERRQWGTFTKDGKTSTVIIEFKPKPSDLRDARNLLTQNELASEVDKLIRTLRVSSKLKEQDSERHPFHVLFGEGWYEQQDHFGLIYRLPTLATPKFRCESLGNILLRDDYRHLLAENLENRLILARALAWTLFELHSVNWVHKSFQPDNILLFAEEIEPGSDNYRFDWSSPYLVGFDSSRTETGHSGRYNPKAAWTARIYTHTERDEMQVYKRFQKVHDIYSLGVVLLEVGLLRSFIDEVIKHHKTVQELPERNERKADPNAMQVDSEPLVFTFNMTTQDFKIVFEKKAEVLTAILGPAYRQVVIKCLNWHMMYAETDNKLSEHFRAEVCEKLSLINIS